MNLKLLSTWMLLLCFENGVCQIEPKAFHTEPFSIGEVAQIQSQILGEARIINIYLPQSYSKDSVQKYPVIYLLDGSANEDFIHIAGIVQFASFSWINMIPESIVVGISNVDRKRDFTFPSSNAQDELDFPTSGGSEKFIRFLEVELQPFINNKYRTNQIKTIIGQSLGGLLATEILFKKPSLFDNYIIVSPSLWWDDESLLTIRNDDLNQVHSIFIGVGKEGKMMEKGAKKLFRKISKQNLMHTKLFYEYFKQLDHGDALHLAVYRAFEQIFEGQLSE